MTFDAWDPSIHEDYQQVKRMISAQSKKSAMEVISIDKEGERLLIQGSSNEPYIASLKECTCMDFRFRQLPCKHMYLLAFELGYMEDLPVYSKKKSSFDSAAELERYKNLYLSGQISAEVYVKLGDALSKA